MKKIILIVLLQLFLIGCDKENDEIPDYREKYVGNYHCGDSIFLQYNCTCNHFYGGGFFIKIFDAVLEINTNGEF